MEFPQTGVRCALTTCSQLDFLPISCSHCANVYCKSHFDPSAHSCAKLPASQPVNLGKIDTYRCAMDSCEIKDVVEMRCSECARHYCVGHRYHGCLDKSEEERERERDRWERPKEEFEAAKDRVDRELLEKCGRRKKSEMARKVQLMKLKGNSIGPPNIPTTDRCYFLVHAPLENPFKNFKSPKGAYVSSTWTVGRVIDALADLFKIPNRNNDSKAPKLRLFDYSTGQVIASKMDVTLKELLDSDSLVNSQDVVMEYSNEDCVDVSKYQ